MIAASLIGYVAMVAAGFALAAGALWCAAWATGKYAWRLWSNLSSIYKLSAMEYWFNRMHVDGTHVLRREHEAKSSAQHDGGAA